MHWWQRRNRDADLDRELRSDLECEIAEQQERGLSQEDARWAAKRAFGNPTLIREQTRETWGWVVLERLIQDLRYAVRALRRSPWFALAAISILSLGIGVNAAIFSLFDGILLQPLPFPEPNRLVRVWGDVVRQQASLRVLQQQSRTTDYAAFADSAEFNLSGLGAPQRLVGNAVSANFFQVLGQRTLAGRPFTPGEDRPGSDRIVLISYRFWKQQLARDPHAIGRTIVIDDVPRRIVGVLPEDFQFPARQTAFWMPLRIDSRDIGAYWWRYNLNIVGRLRPGTTTVQAQAELRTLVPQIRDAFPWKMWPDWGQKAKLVALQETLVGNLRTRLSIMFAAVGLVLLIACANVANLLLARSANRQREIAVRAALGATRPRILRQLLTESLLLAISGSALGLVLAVAMHAVMRSVLPADLPQLGIEHLNLRVLLFTTLLTLATALIFGIVPAWQSSRTAILRDLKAEERGTSGNRRKQRLSFVLMAFEIAVAAVVIISSSLLTVSFFRLTNVNPGFDQHRVLTALLTPNPSQCKIPSSCVAVYQELLNRTRAMPGVLAAAGANPLPLSGDLAGGAIELENHPVLPGHSAPTLLTSAITPDYLDVLQIPLLAGRSFQPSDSAGAAPVVLVTVATARHWWPGQNPIGKHIRNITEKRWRTVVGLVGNTEEASLAGGPDWAEGHVYYPLPQADFAASRIHLLLRTSGDPSPLSTSLRNTIAHARPDIPIAEIRTMSDVVSGSVQTPRFTMWLLFSFAALALLLSLTGVYAIITYAVAHQTHEIGIRMALGARASHVVLGLLTRSLRASFAGLAAGVALALATSKVLSTLLFQVTPRDPAIYTAVPLTLLILVLFATYLPARRAAKVDPLISLRHD